MRFLVFLSKGYIFSVASLCSNIFWHWNLWIWTGLDKYVHICLNISHFVLTLTRFKSCLSSHSLGFAPFTAVVHTSASFKADHVTAIRNSLSLPFTPTCFLCSANQQDNFNTFICNTPHTYNYIHYICIHAKRAEDRWRERREQKLFPYFSRTKEMARAAPTSVF